MYDDGDWEEGEDEIAIRIEPKEEVLERLGISFEAFEEALGDAIDAHEAKLEALTEGAEAPTVEDMNVRIGDRDYRLSELADVVISDESE